jgi:hypothetical protein
MHKLELKDRIVKKLAYAIYYIYIYIIYAHKYESRTKKEILLLILLLYLSRCRWSMNIEKENINRLRFLTFIVIFFSYYLKFLSKLKLYLKEYMEECI